MESWLVDIAEKRLQQRYWSPANDKDWGRRRARLTK
jgi:hypothetical protein